MSKPVRQFIKYIDLGDMIVSVQCPTCMTELPSTHEAFDLQYILDYVKKNGGWGIFDEDAYRKIETFQLGNGKNAVVAARKTSYDPGDIDTDYYGELPQGTEFSTFVVIKVDDAYFKKTGTGDSYGNVAWDGDLIRVQPVEKTVVEYR